MSGSTQLQPIPPVTDKSDMTTGFFNSRFNALQSNIVSVNSAVLSPSQLSDTTFAALTLVANSNNSSYIRFVDSAGQRSNYRIGSVDGGTADGLNFFDESGNTMIASFSKQSIRFYQQVVGPVFDVGGALADTLNAATFGTGADSRESRIQAAISQATSEGISRVYVPATMYPYSAASVVFSTAVRMIREGGPLEVADVRAYGAHANGSRDDSIAAISAHSFLHDASGGVLYFSPTTLSYKLNTQVYLNKNDVHVMAHGATFTSDTSIIMFRTAATRRVSMVGPTFDMRSNKTTYGCILIEAAAQDCNLDQLLIYADSASTASFKGITVDDAYFTTIDRSQFNNTGGTGLFGGAGAVYLQNEANYTRITNCDFGSCVSGLVVDDANTARSTNNSYEQCTDSIVISDEANNTGFYSNGDRFELNVRGITVKLTADTPVPPRIEGAFFTGNSDSGVSNPNAVKLDGDLQSGSVVLADASDTTTIVFQYNEDDANYQVNLCVGAESGSPALGAHNARWGSRTNTGFGIGLEAAPGAGTSVRVFWQTYR